MLPLLPDTIALIESRAGVAALIAELRRIEAAGDVAQVDDALALATARVLEKA